MHLPADQMFVPLIDSGIVTIRQNVNKTFDKKWSAFTGHSLHVVT